MDRDRVSVPRDACHLKLTPGVNVQSLPKVAKVYGTNDSLTWTVLKSWSDLTPSTIEDTQTVAVDAADAYKRFATTQSGREL